MSQVNYQIATIFPDMYGDFASHGMMRRAIEQEIVSLSTINLRDFAVNSQKQVDDTPYGGGAGMVLRPEPAISAIKHAKEKSPEAKVVLLTPRGVPFSQKQAKELAAQAQQDKGLIFLCSRYEGVDERVVKQHVDYEISLGDYVVMGGDVPTMICLEAITRLLPEVLGNPESIKHESFEGDYLEHPQYTKPAEYDGQAVPEVLLSGNHAKVEKWREQKRYEDTARRRPDLFRVAETAAPKNVSAALIHYPVVDKQNMQITSSVTNIDLHDISRSARTFGIKNYYVIHPVKAMRRLVEKICGHWATGYGSTYNQNRSDAIGLINVVPDIEDMLLDIEQRTGKLPKLISTSAKPGEEMIDYDEMRAEIFNSDDEFVILFGTGWGLADEILERASYRLKPVYGPGDYNHLSVRSAAAIIFANLFARKD